MCKSCKGPSKGRPNNCCPAYSQQNRSTKYLIYNMEMVAVKVEHVEHVDFE